jgi:uncharacterized protein YjdB
MALPRWQETDNRLGIRLASLVNEEQQDILSNAWRFIHSSWFDGSTVSRLADAISTTHKPQYLGLCCVDGGKHAVLAYRIDATERKIYVANPNYPGDTEQYISYAQTIDSYMGYDEIRFVPMDYFSMSAISAQWARLEDGTIGAAEFPSLSVTRADNGSAVVDNDILSTTAASMSLTAGTDYFIEVYHQDGRFLASGSTPNIALSEGSEVFGIEFLKKDPAFPLGQNSKYVDFWLLTIVRTPAPVATVTVAPPTASVAVGGTVPLIATTKDAVGATLTGRAVAWSSSNTSVATVNSSGVVTGVAAGSASISATSEGKSGAAALTVTPGPASTSQSVVSVSNGTVASGGVVTLTLQAKNSSGTNLTTGGLTVVFTASGGTSTGTIGPTTDLLDGRYTATFTAVNAGTATTVGATIGVPAVAVTSTLPTITVAPPRVVSTSMSTVSVSAGTVASGGTVTLQLQAKDANGNNLITGGLAVVFTASGGTSTGTIGVTTDWANGRYTAVFTAVTAGTATTVGATIWGAAVTSTLPTIRVTPSTVVSQSQSTVVAVPTSIAAGGGLSTITVTAKDGAGSPISGAAVVLAATGTGNTLTQPAGTTNASGVATGALSSTVAGIKTVSATISGVAITQTANVTVTVVPVASVTVAPPASSITVGGTVQLTATTKDAVGATLAGRTVTWTSANTSVATVGASSGLVTGVAVGSATITATSEGKNGTASVTVMVARTLSVQSDPTGVLVTVSPLDRDGSANGYTPFTRVYGNQATVTLVAASSLGGAPFDHWEKDGANAGTATSLTVTMDANHTLKAVYRSLKYISGQVTSAGVGVGGVAIAFSGIAQPATTASDGTYTIPVSYGYTGTATPSKSGCTNFTPTSRPYSNVITQMTGQNYTASCPAGVPDLIITGITYRGNWLIGSGVTPMADVLNQGTGAAGAFKVAIYLSTDQTLGGDTFLCELDVAGLDAGAIDAAQKTCTVPNITKRDYYLIGVADSGNAITSETNKRNNTFATSYVVTVY